MTIEKLKATLDKYPKGSIHLFYSIYINTLSDFFESNGIEAYDFIKFLEEACKTHSEINDIHEALFDIQKALMDVELSVREATKQITDQISPQ